MHKFNEGDWIVIEYTSIYHMKPFVTQFNNQGNLDNQPYIKKVSKWEPKIDEIVWYLSVHEEAGLMRYVGKNGKYYQCKTLTGEAIFNCLCIEPFIGILPIKIQNKLKEIKDGIIASKNN